MNIGSWLMASPLLLCTEAGTVDRVEGDRAVVLGATGVHVVSVGAIRGRHSRGVREGDRVEMDSLGRCVSRPPTYAELEAIRRRLRALGVVR